MDTLLQDARSAVRVLRTAPGFAAVAVLTLGLGIGATTCLFSVVHGVLFRPLPYPEPDRIVRVLEVDSGGQPSSHMSDPNFVDLAEQSDSFEALAQYQTFRVSVVGGNEPARVLAAQVSRDFFRVLGVEPSRGRGFRADELRPGTAPVALVSHGYWQRYLGGAADLAGQELTYGELVVPVVGVMPPGFGFPEGADLWFPRETEPMSASRTALNRKTIGRLAPETSLASARAEAGGLARRLAAHHGDDTWMADVALVPLREELVGPTRRPLLLLLGASGLLLLIAAANVVSLLLARAASRGHEVGMRIALGAGRLRLARQSLAESLVLSLSGGALGVLLARWGVGLLGGLAAGRLPRAEGVRVDGTVLLFALAASVAVAVGLALLTSWRAAGNGTRALVQAPRGQAGTGTSRLRGALVVAQLALTLVLLVGTGLLLRSFGRLLAADPGYRTDGAVVLNCYLAYPQSEAQEARQQGFHERLIARLEALPGVAAVGGIDDLPLRPGGANGTFLLLERPDEATDLPSFQRIAQIPGRTGSAEFRRALPGYFAAMRIPLLAGRPFDQRDQPDAPHVAVVSESLAASAWPGEDPLGKLVQFGNMDGDLRPFTVVGVVGDVRDGSLEAEPRPTFYANARQRPGALAGPFEIVVVTEGEAAAAMVPVRAVVRQLDPQVAPSLTTLEEIYAGALTDRRFQLILLVLFAAAALALAVVGVYGLVSFHVAQRRREIGVRMAVGASGNDLVWMVVRQGLRLALFGVVVGLAGALVASRLMRSLLYGVSSTDPLTLLAVPLLLVVAAIVACLLPGRRAARIDPATALRT